MTTQVILLTAAEIDLKTAADRYRHYRPSLGTDFILCVDETLSRIAHNPLAYTRLVGAYRKALVHRFPFSVIYQMLNYDAFVIAIQHSSRHQDTWRDRTQ